MARRGRGTKQVQKSLLKPVAGTGSDEGVPLAMRGKQAEQEIAQLLKKKKGLLEGGGPS